MIPVTPTSAILAIYEPIPSSAQSPAQGSQVPESPEPESEVPEKVAHLREFRGRLTKSPNGTARKIGERLEELHTALEKKTMGADKHKEEIYALMELAFNLQNVTVGKDEKGDPQLIGLDDAHKGTFEKLGIEKCEISALTEKDVLLIHADIGIQTDGVKGIIATRNKNSLASARHLETLLQGMRRNNIENEASRSLEGLFG